MGHVTVWAMALPHPPAQGGEAMRVRFDEVTRRATIYQTINPWNQNKDGSTKTRAEVAASVDAEVGKWMNCAEECPRCGLPARPRKEVSQ